MTGAPSFAQTNILLIEDTPSDAEIVRAYLEDISDQKPFNVIHALNMDDAMRTMATVKIHAVMLDLLLPDTEDLSGLDSVRTLLPSVPVLILTGRDDEELAFRAVETGAQDYLLKDKINPRMLKRSILYAMQRKRFEDRIIFQAHFDPLTHLPNRQHFKDRLDIALARSLRTNNGLSIMMLDLDGFKDINDTFGHDMGDKVLCETGKRIVSCLRPYDIAARFGGDEFLVLVEDINRTSTIETIAKKITAEISAPMTFLNTKLHIGASIGIVLSRPDENLSVDILLHRADQAMYAAKRFEKSGYRFFEPAYADMMKMEAHPLR